MRDIDRTRAQQLGLNVNTIANNLNISLSSSEQVTPNFWTDPKTGHSLLPRGADAGDTAISSLNELDNTPVATALSSTDGGRAGAECARQRGHRHGAAAFRLQPVQHPAGLRCLCQRAGPRSRQRRQPDQQSRGRTCRSSSSPATRSVIGQIESMNSAFANLASACCSPRSSSIC